MQKIQNCPNCGSEPRTRNAHYVKCSNPNCDMYGPTGKTSEEAITLWNSIRMDTKEPEKKEAKFVQFQFQTTQSEDGTVLAALDDNGDVWSFSDNGWKKMNMKRINEEEKQNDKQK